MSNLRINTVTGKLAGPDDAEAAAIINTITGGTRNERDREARALAALEATRRRCPEEPKG